MELVILFGALTAFNVGVTTAVSDAVGYEPARKTPVVEIESCQRTALFDDRCDVNPADADRTSN